MSDDDLAARDETARRLAGRWNFEAVGRRPQDYRAWDLLFGSLFRSAAAGRFNRLVKEWRRSPPDWARPLLCRLGPNDLQHAVPLLVLQWEWQRFLLGIDPTLANVLELVDGGPGIYAMGEPIEDDDFTWQDLEEVIQEEDPVKWSYRNLRDCYPLGALLGWAGDKALPEPRVCRLARLCPWCHARRAEKIYHQLTKGVLRRPREGTHLVLLQTSIGSTMLPFDRSEAYRWIDRVGGNPTGAWFMQGNVLNFRRGLRQEDFDLIEEEVVVPLQRLARQAGLAGGLTVHKVGPHEEKGLHVYRHDISIVGEVNLADPKARERFEWEMGITGPTFRMVTTAAGEARNLFEYLYALAIPASAKNALRYLLFGTSATYDTRCLPLVTRESAYGHWLRNGIPGAFRREPLFVFDRVQWVTAFDVLRGKPLYRPFGTWRPKPEDTAAARQEEGLEAANRKRAEDSQVGREGLLAVAAKLWPQVRAAARCGTAGRPGYATKLQEELQGRGHRPSRRDVAWLLQQLRSRESKGGPS